MSKKPLKMSDQKKLNALMQKKTRSHETLELVPPYTYIVSEGVKTEPHYINGLVERINDRYKKYTSADHIIVEGTGRNTRSLLDYARTSVDKKFPKAQDVWLMYDKDDFPYDDFDNTQYSAEERKDKRNYHAAWSNECIELWFLLHFQNLHSNVGRERYYDMLNGHFRRLGYKKYEKNLKNIYDILEGKTNDAISRAKKLYNEYDREAPPSKKCPATRVYELVEELMKYI